MIRLLIAIQLALPAQELCFPAPAADYDRSEYRKAMGRRALLEWKARHGLFDLRLCETSWKCPFQAEAAAELRAAQGDLARLGVLGDYLGGGKATTAATAGKIAKAADGAGGSVGDYLDKLESGLGALNGQIDTIRKTAEDAMKETKVSLLDAAAKANLAQKKLEILDQYAERGVRKRNEKFRIEREKLAAERDQANIVRLRLEEDNDKYSTAVADAKRMQESLKRGTPYVGYVKKLHGLWKNASAGDAAGGLKAFAEASELLAGWELKRLDASIAANGQAARTMFNSYHSLRQARSAGKIGLNTHSTLVGNLAKAQAANQAAGARLQLDHEILTRLNAGAQAAKTSYESLVKYGKSARAVGEAIKGLDGTIRGNNEAMRGDIPAAALSAINYFDGLSIVLSEVAGAQGDSLDQMAVESVALSMRMVAEIPKAFVRAQMRQQQGASFDRQTFDIKFLHETVEAHPALRGLRATLPDNVPNAVDIPNAARTDTLRIDRASFNFVLQALSTWTSLSGVNADQEVLYRLAKGYRQKSRKPNNGSLLFDTVYFDVAELADANRRKTIEEDIGRALMEVEYLNEARKFRTSAPGGDPAEVENQVFAYTDLLMAGVPSADEFFGPLIDRWNRSDRVKELKRLNYANQLANLHERLDDAFFIVYGKDMPEKVFGAVLAQTKDLNVRNAENVGPIEKGLLARRNRTENDARTIQVAAVTPRQVKFDEVHVPVHLARVSGAPGARVCIEARLNGGTGTMAQARGADELGPSTPVFTAKIDWARAGAAPRVEGIVTARFEGAFAVTPATFSIAIDPPITAESLRALPDRTFRGQVVSLRLVSALSDLAPGTPEVKWTARSSSGGTVSIQPVESFEENQVALIHTAKFTVPPDAQIGSVYSIDAEIDFHGWKTRASTVVTVIADPEVEKDSEAPPNGFPSGGCSETELRRQLGAHVLPLLPGLPYFGDWQKANPRATLDPLAGRFGKEIYSQGYRKGSVTASVGWSISCGPVAAQKPLNCNDFLPSAMPRGTSKDAGLGERSCTVSSLWPASDVDLISVAYAAEKDGVRYVTSAGFGIFGPDPCCQKGPMEQLRAQAEGQALGAITKLLGFRGMPPTANPVIAQQMLPSIFRDGPESAALFGLARASIARQDIVGATQQMQRAAADSPGSAAAQFNLSVLHLAQGKTTTALKHADGYLQLAPNAPDRAEFAKFAEALRRDLAENPRSEYDASGCADILAWARTEAAAARQRRDNNAATAALEIQIAAQRGDCDGAVKLKNAYGVRK
jgi:hypothetical protein